MPNGTATIELEKTGAGVCAPVSIPGDRADQRELVIRQLGVKAGRLSAEHLADGRRVQPSKLTVRSGHSGATVVQERREFARSMARRAICFAAPCRQCYNSAVDFFWSRRGSKSLLFLFPIK